MDDSTPPDQATAGGLGILCPGCGHIEADEYEVLDANDVHAIRCSACGLRFHLLLAECPRCEEETPITWPDVPTPSAIRQLRCSHCDASLIQHEQVLDSMGLWPTR
jgi:transcription elongation factor Elf1